MKRNAIIRIILWSMVLVLLTGLLFAGLFGAFGMGFRRRQYAAEAEATAIPMRITEPVVAGVSERSAYASDNVNIRAMPSTDAEIEGMLEAGDSVVISHQESVNGQEWAFITEPAVGWVQSHFLSQTETPMVEETMVSSETDGIGYSVTNSITPITEIDIEWVAGDILIQPGISDQITVEEDGNFEEQYAMVLSRNGTKLEISFCQDSLSSRFGISTLAKLEKDLTITVPADWYCEALEIDAASANLEVNDLNLGEVEFDGASGICTFENCTVRELDVDTVSGNVRFIGALETLSCDATSASIYTVLTNVPRRMEMDTMSGNVELNLPQDAGFTLNLDAASGKFTTNFDITTKNNAQLSGDGACRIEISTHSGDVTIQKASE